MVRNLTHNDNCPVNFTRLYLQSRQSIPGKPSLEATVEDIDQCKDKDVFISEEILPNNLSLTQVFYKLLSVPHT